MSKNPNQKLKLLRLFQILSSHSDEEHPVSVAELISRLEEQGISAERKSIYADLEVLRLSGLDIKNRKGHRPGWFLASRQFDPGELKLLVDAVQTAPFLERTQRESLTQKLAALTSCHQARQLQRSLCIPRHYAPPGIETRASIDKLHSAIAAGRAVTFRYASPDAPLSGSSPRMTLSPYSLIWDEGIYYLAAYDSLRGEMGLYRPDCMEDLVVTTLPREGESRFADFDPARFAREHLKPGKSC